MNRTLFKSFTVVFAILAAGGIMSATAGETAGEATAGAVQHASAASMEYMSTIFVFMLSTFVGLDIIRRVSRLLHTPLMSLTNAISAISVVGAILITSREDATMLSKILGFIAITAVVTNIVSGFLITDRMVKMFKKRGAQK